MNIRYILKKTLYGFLIILSVVFALSFIFFSFINKDGKAVYEMTGQNTDQQTVDEIKKAYHLDQPVWKQVLYYANDLSFISVYPQEVKHKGIKLFGGSQKYWMLKTPYLGKSFQTDRSVGETISKALPGTIVLAFAAILFATLLGIILGIFAAKNQNTWIDRAIIFLASGGMALPSFFAAILMSWLLGYVLHAFTGLPTWGSLYNVDEYTGEKYLSIKNLILPALTLGIRPLSVIAQLTRNNLLEIQKMDFIRTAIAKGLAPNKILVKHTLINIANPLITAISGWLGGMLAGAVFIEYIFGWQGIGKTLVDGLQKLDYPVVMGSVITITCIFVLLNIIVDIMYAVVDPRVRLKG
jgi:peptide/nickel transport system permease protein